MRYALGFLAILLALGAGCKSQRALEQRYVAAEAAVDEQQIPARAVAELRDAYNAGCGSAFKEADERLPREQQLAGRSWVVECTQLQRTLGPWLPFDVESNLDLRVLGTALPRLRFFEATGTAKFRNGVCHVEIVWSLNTHPRFKASKPQLVSLTILGRNGHLQRFPGPDGRPSRQLMDPPPRPTGSKRAAA
jgi:hypothetical protein